MPDAPSSSDAGIRLLHALVDEIKAIAHDPQAVHLIADKLKHGIDALADAIAEDPAKSGKK